MDDVLYWLWLALKSGAGSSDAVKLLQYFPGAREIYEASHEELLSARDCDRGYLNRLRDHNLTEAENVLEFCFTNNIRVVTCASECYPHRLHTLYNKPLVLYVRGSLEMLRDRLCVGIVGTRKMTPYGKRATFHISRELCGHGAVIISGAAYGVDTVANNTAVYFEGETIAVLGSGVNVPYPAVNKDMLDKIAERGAVISEYRPGTPPHGHNFPVRNRIISGLSDAVLVVEAGERSGALITARKACDQGRRVYAVPGNIYNQPESVGTNYLIRDGAKLCTRAADILEDFADVFTIREIDRIVRSDQYLRYDMHNASKPVKPAGQPRPAEQPKPVQQTRQPEPKAPVKPIPAEAAAVEHTHPLPETIDDMPRESESTQSTRSEFYGKLSELQRQIYDAMPEADAVTSDKIAQTGIPASDVLASLTILELFGAVESLPGGLYRKLI